MEYRVISAPGTADEHIFEMKDLWFLDIHKPLISGNIGAGFCPTSYISVKLTRGDATIPPKAELQIQGRESASADWQPLGTYWVGKRSGPDPGPLTLTAYNAMRKAQQDYVDLTQITAWPAPMSAVVADIAAILGVEIDPRTAVKTGNDYMVSYPLWDASNAASGSLTMQEVLSWIAAAHGGNFVVTNANALYLLPLAPAADAAVQDIGAGCRKLESVADPLTISRVTVWMDSDNYFTAGDDTGHELKLDCPYATQTICDDLLAQLGGYTYVPFKAERAAVAMTTEPGDLLQIKGSTYYIGGMDIHCGAAFLADLQAPAAAETDDEFPVRSQADRQLAQLKASTAQTAQKVGAVERVSVEHSVSYYLATSASSDVTHETEGWTEAMQQMSAEKKYLWQYRKLAYMDGRVEDTEPGIIGVYGDTGATGATGATGNGVQSIVPQYCVSDSKTTAPTDGWTTTTPTWSAGKYLWKRECITYTNGTTEYTTPVCDNSWEAINLLNQEEIFNRLTNNGEWEGLYKDEDGNIYINATYIKSGQLLADLIKAGVIRSKDGEKVVIDLDNGKVNLTGSITTEEVDGDYGKTYAKIFPGGVQVEEYGDSVDSLAVLLANFLMFQWSRYDAAYRADKWYIRDLDSDSPYGIEAQVDSVTDEIASLTFTAPDKTLTISVVNGGRSKIAGLDEPVDDTDATNKQYVDTGLATKAPAGYGYGGTVIALGTVADEAALEAAVTTMFSAMADNEAKQVQFVVTALGNRTFLGTVFRTSEGYGFVTAMSGLFSHATQITKYYEDGTWFPIEWVNPAMAIGVEYRTTERWNGMPVYTQLVDFGALPNASEKSVTVSGMYFPFFVCGLTSDTRSIPHGSYITVRATSQSLSVKTTVDYSTKTATILVKYTKER